MELSTSLGRLAAAWRRVDAPQARALRPGLAAAAVRELLRPWSAEPPEELIELVGWADGMDGSELVPGARLLPLALALERGAEMRELAVAVAGPAGVDPGLVWEAGWLPLLESRGASGEGSHHVIAASDVAGAGRAVWWHDREGDTLLAFDGIGAMLATAAECWDAGAYAAGEDGSALEADPFFAAECFRRHNPRAAAGPARGAPADEIVSSLVEALVHGDGAAQGEAAATLMRRKDVAAVPRLTEILAGPSPVVRGLAARVLGETGDAAAVPGLIARLADPDQGVVAYAATALATIGDTRAVPALLDALRASRPDTVGGVARALGTLGAVEAIELLEPVLAGGAVPTRLTVVGVLGALTDPRIPAILTGLLADPQPQLRAAAASGLGKKAYAEAVIPLVACLGDADWQVRVVAVGALRAVGDPAAIAPIERVLEALGGEGDPDPRTAALRTSFRAAAERTLQALAGTRPR